MPCPLATRAYREFGTCKTQPSTRCRVSPYWTGASAQLLFPFSSYNLNIQIPINRDKARQISRNYYSGAQHSELFYYDSNQTTLQGYKTTIWMCACIWGAGYIVFACGVYKCIQQLSLDRSVCCDQGRSPSVRGRWKLAASGPTSWNWRFHEK